MELPKKEVRFKSFQNINIFKQALIEEFNNKCAYCGSQLGITSQTQIDHFYPRSRFPDKADQIDNLFLCCHICNVNKRDQFPVDDDGLLLLLNPRVDNIEEHIKYEKDGTVIPITEKGRITIDILQLNRPGLIEDWIFRRYAPTISEICTH